MLQDTSVTARDGFSFIVIVFIAEFNPGFYRLYGNGIEYKTCEPVRFAVTV